MSTKERQSRLLGELSGDSITLETSGRVIRPALELPTALVDELRLHVSEDGIRMTAVDPANVGMVGCHIHPAAFESFDADDFVTGINVSELSRRLSKARLGKSNDDDVDIELDDGRAVIEIEREYDETTATFSEEMLTIDPDAIRQEPDIPDLERSLETTISTEAFKAAVEHIDSSSDYVDIRANGRTLVFGGASHEDSDSEYGAAVEFEDAIPQASPEGMLSNFSLGYLSKMADGLNKAKADEVTLQIGEEFPMSMIAQREIDEEIAYEVEYVLAPRIESGN